MGYQARNVELSYEFQRLVPEHDPEMQYFQEFLKTFGEDDNVLVIGFKDSSVFRLAQFNQFAQVCDTLAKMQGVNEVLALPRLQYLVKDTIRKEFTVQKVFAKRPASQRELDSTLRFIKTLKIYESQLLNEQTGAMLLAIAVNKSFLNSSKRVDLVANFKRVCERFGKETNIKIHYAGLPFARTILAAKVKDELVFFLWISVAVTAFTVFLFYRSLYPVLVSMALIGITIVWAVGTLGIFGYKITMLNGLMPPILVIVAIPNAVYLITKYQQEYLQSGNQREALKKVVSRIGFVTVIVNLTTAISFFVFIWGDVVILKEFGIATGLNTCFAFVISIIFVPAVFSYLPPPNIRDTKHLEFKPMQRLLETLVVIAQRYRWLTYLLTITSLVVFGYGMTQIRTLAYMVDDIPEKSEIKQDLRFFEANFGGVMPLEIVVDTGKRRGIRKRANLQKIDSLENFLLTLPEVSHPLSYTDFLKTANQTYFNGDTEAYRLPSRREEPFVYSYIKSQGDDNENLLKAFVDSAQQKIRISVKVADMGTLKMDSLITHKIKPKIAEITKGSELKVHITGTSLLFVKGNQYLISSLVSGTWMAILFVALAHGLLFFNLRIIIISLIPNIIPLIITAGLMGFLNVPLKPSTIIIFSIVLGIAVDNTVHFLARYRLGLYDNDYDVITSVMVSIRETGYSMIYTSLVLFAGFIIFMMSEFGGTVSLGWLTSLTLMVALITNLTILPALLVTFDKEK
jgi:predicted RND superfamily exporter protein